MQYYIREMIVWCISKKYIDNIKYPAQSYYNDIEASVAVSLPYFTVYGIVTNYKCTVHNG